MVGQLAFEQLGTLTPAVGGRRLACTLRRPRLLLLLRPGMEGGVRCLLVGRAAALCATAAGVVQNLCASMPLSLAATTLPQRQHAPAAHTETSAALQTRHSPACSGLPPAPAAAVPPPRGRALLPPLPRSLAAAGAPPQRRPPPPAAPAAPLAGQRAPLPLTHAAPSGGPPRAPRPPARRPLPPAALRPPAGPDGGKWGAQSADEGLILAEGSRLVIGLMTACEAAGWVGRGLDWQPPCPRHALLHSKHSRGHG